ncbi:hypothetical protein FQA47_006900 [Oryzias melastigma]|uniref:Uncharacterized protein n=1 Tax=Oryzias melastigma TaxID=30732 RepID=A0A834CFP2_ORYME|nr:hypothetical protein FQA47_006900 [Oryzias melastigma]
MTAGVSAVLPTDEQPIQMFSDPQELRDHVPPGPAGLLGHCAPQETSKADRSSRRAAGARRSEHVRSCGPSIRIDPRVPPPDLLPVARSSSQAETDYQNKSR